MSDDYGDVNILQTKIETALGNNAQHVKNSIQSFRDMTLGMHDRIYYNDHNENDIRFLMANETLFMSLPNSDVAKNNQLFTIHDNALSQISERFGIRAGVIPAYIHGVLWQQQLAQTILNEHAYNIEPKRYLIRSVNDEVRGFLSDKFKRFNSADIVGTFLQTGQEYGLTPISSHVGDTKVFFESIIPKVFQIRTELNGTVNVVFGARISISDFGDGALNISTYMINVVCMNGMCRDTQLKAIHMGSQLPDNIEMSDETHRISTLEKISLTKDILKSTFSEDKFIQQAQIIKKAGATSIDPDQFKIRLPRMGMLKTEIEQMEQLFLVNKQEDGLHGEMSLWKMAQGVSALGRDMDPRRKRELDDIAGRILTL